MNLPNSRAALIDAAQQAINGANLHEASIGLLQNTEASIGTDRTGLITTESAYNAAKSARSPQFQTRGTASETTRVFLMQVVDALKPHPGREWGPPWVAAGFEAPTLEIPHTQGGRLGLLPLLAAFLTANTSYENAGMGATAAHCTARHTAFADAIASADEQRNLAFAAWTARDHAEDALRRRMQGLAEELRQLITPEDPRWAAFGIAPPGYDILPEVPGMPSVMPGAPGSHSFTLSWLHALRADRYHVYILQQGDPAPVLAGSTEDEDLMIDADPSGTLLVATVTAVNDAGETGPSPGADVTVP